MRSAVAVTSATLLMMLGYLPGLAAQSREMQSDRAHRDTSIHWPAAYDPSIAPVFSHNELVIHAGCHSTFAWLADAPNWPNWLVIVKDVANETPGVVGQGALYRLRIFNSPIQSRVTEFVADQRISWIPFGADETETRHGHYHAWHFVPQSADCLVITEETGVGPGDRKTQMQAATSCTKHMNFGWRALSTSVSHERVAAHARLLALVMADALDLLIDPIKP